jgi:hypothetical protein
MSRKCLVEGVKDAENNPVLIFNMLKWGGSKEAREKLTES